MITAVDEMSDPAATAVVGHFQSFGHQEDRGGNDRFQGTADVGRRPRAVTKSPKPWLTDLRRQPE
jgi:hypothetical protein